MERARGYLIHAWDMISLIAFVVLVVALGVNDLTAITISGITFIGFATIGLISGTTGPIQRQQIRAAIVLVFAIVMLALVWDK